MLLEIARFELRYQLRQPLFWVTAAIFALLAFVATTTDALGIGGAIGSLDRNAPYVVVRMLGNLSLTGIFIVVAFVATSVLRDFEWGTAELVFSRPVRPRDLLLGRFAGSLAAACACFTFAAVGLAIGSRMPWLDPARVGPFRALPYLYGLGVLAFPSFVILGAAFFALASRVRHVMAVYVALVALLVAYFVAGALFGDLESQGTAALLDPFGMSAFDLQTRYWTVAEKNSLLPPLAGALLWSRLLWLGLGLGVLALAVGRFRYDRALSRRKRARVLEAEPSVGLTVGRRVRQRPTFLPGTAWAQLGSQFRLEARGVIWTLPFVLILAFSLINVLANMSQLDLMLGTSVWPVTYLMLLAVRAGYSFLLIVIVTFFAGELIWRERRLKLDGVVGALPVPTWVPLVAKLLGLWAAAAVFIAAGMLGLIGFQVFHGYTHVQPLLYAQGLVVETFPFFLSATLALFLQVALNQKFAGYLAMVLFLISSAVLRALHYDHFLYRYGGVPAGPYSDLNGWGHYAAPIFWFNLYWSFLAGVFVCVSYLGAVRGAESGWRLRWKEARARFRGPLRWGTALLLLGFAATGAFIFYNTNVLNEYVPSDEGARRQAAYEKKYRQYRDAPQPRIVATRADVDIFPGERRVLIRGSYRLANRSALPIPALHIGMPSRVRIRRLDLPPHKVILEDRPLGYSIYELATPLQPGQEISFGFDLELANPGFTIGADNAIVGNGTFFNVRHFPSLGYLDYRELGDPAERRRRGLPEIIRMAKIDDMPARFCNDLARDTDRMDFETTVSTSADQIAIAPGTLQREWTEGGRRYFHYKMDTKIPKFFSYLSGRYTVRRDSWEGVGIEVFHHPGHEYNVDKMVGAIKKTLDYMTANFGPYQHRQIRIVEFPRYSRLAASFPGTIPFSESIGFIARLKDQDSIDYPVYVTAHEVAHQWWGYQVMGASVQGSAMLSESMAQYSALMVMEKEFGPEKMRRFLRYELDRYLSGRGGELLEELPLELVEDQGYIHYSKGSLALYALKDYIGEERLNGALRRYIASVRFQDPPYTVSRDLLAFVAEVTPPEQRHVLEDLFGSITLFQNEAVAATSRRLPDGRYEVTLKAFARKLRADGKGVETEVPLDDWIDVGVFGEKTRTAGKTDEPVLYMKKQHFTQPEATVEVVVEGRPARAGIDPYNKLIDRIPSDNVRAVTGS